MQCKPFPVIDLVATGQNILRLREERGLSVRDLQAYFGFEEPQAIYKWQRGKCLPSVDNLYALGCLLEVPMEDILVRAAPNFNYIHSEEQASACSSHIIQIYAEQAWAIGRGGMYVASGFFRSKGGGKTIPWVRIAPRKSRDFQQSADFFLLDENPQIFIESVENAILTRKEEQASACSSICQKGRFFMSRRCAPCMDANIPTYI